MSKLYFESEDNLSQGLNLKFEFKMRKQKKKEKKKGSSRVGQNVPKPAQYSFPTRGPPGALALMLGAHM
jgi:hypothetical protein